MVLRPRRSVLYVPAVNARALTKCRTLDADGIILDLEDAVAPADKPSARAAAVRALAEGGFGHREVVVRVNGGGTPWNADDLLAAAGARPNAVLLPKAGRPEDVMAAARRLDELGAPPSVRIWAMVETPAAVLGVAGLARAAADPASRLDVLVVGTNDLAADLHLRVGPGREALAPGSPRRWRRGAATASTCSTACSTASTTRKVSPPKPGRDVTSAWTERPASTRARSRRSTAINGAFAPEPAEVAWARRIVGAFDGPERSGANVLRVDGRMVERLHAEAGRRTIALAEALVRRAADPTSAL